MSRQPDAIGGYFGLEVPAPSRQEILHPEALRFQSARAALVALLRTVRPQRLWLPRLICDSVGQAASHAGVPTVSYGIDAETGLPSGVSLRPRDLLLYVNLFGVMGDAARAVLRDFPPQQVVLDCAQALFFPPGDCLATLYSPRKFLGVPDGGLLVTGATIKMPRSRDDGSQGRCAHLLKRLGGEVEEGYADFQAAEGTLDDPEPKLMSVLTERLLASIDVDATRRRRQRNAAALHRHFRATNQWPFKIRPADAPLCYPLLRDTPRDDALMRRARVYLPTYWPEARSRCPAGSWERRLLETALPLPLDQRYDVGPAFLGRMAQAGIVA